MPTENQLELPGILEPCLTLPAAAKQLGIPVWSLRRAINKGVVPSFTLGSKRRLVRASDILAAISAAKREPSSGQGVSDA